MAGTERKFQFTEDKIKALPVPEPGKKIRYQDAKVAGLSVLVTGNGSKAYYLYRRFKGTLYEKQIAACRDMGLAQARRTAEEWIGQLTRGEEPGAIKRKHAITFAELFEWFMESHGRKAKDGGARRRMQFNNYLQPLASKHAAKLTRADIIAVQERIAEKIGGASANRSIDLVRAVYNLSIDRNAHGLTTNPAKKIPKAEESKGRERRLEQSEIGPFMAALDAEPLEDIRDLVLLALFTGARRANVLGMRWEQINSLTKAWTIPNEAFKTGETHIVPLTREAQAIIERRQKEVVGPWVFPSPKGKGGRRTSPYYGLKTILDRAGIQGFTFHDLRRTCASFMGEAGVDTSMIALILGHSVTSVTGIYNRPGLESRREALQRGVDLMLLKAGRSE